MNRRHPLKSLLVFAVVAAAAGSLQAAEPGGMRQLPLDPPGGRGRLPGPAQPGPGVPGAPGPSRPSPDERRAPGPTSIDYKGTRYVVSDGQWYVKRGDDLVAVPPPAGVLVPDLPEGYSMRWIGGVPYFYADGLYYVWRERSRRYEIMQNPPAAEPAAPREPKPEAGHEHATAP